MKNVTFKLSRVNGQWHVGWSYGGDIWDSLPCSSLTDAVYFIRREVNIGESIEKYNKKARCANTEPGIEELTEFAGASTAGQIMAEREAVNA
jgi:hypothetical protein